LPGLPPGWPRNARPPEPISSSELKLAPSPTPLCQRSLPEKSFNHRPKTTGQKSAFWALGHRQFRKCIFGEFRTLIFGKRQPGTPPCLRKSIVPDSQHLRQLPKNPNLYDEFPVSHSTHLWAPFSQCCPSTFMLTPTGHPFAARKHPLDWHKPPEQAGNKKPVLAVKRKTKTRFLSQPLISHSYHPSSPSIAENIR